MEQAERHILAAYHLNPEDVYSLLLLGKFYLGNEVEQPVTCIGKVLLAAHVAA